MCHILPHVWLDNLRCVEPLSLVSFVHVPRNSILFESIPGGDKASYTHTFKNSLVPQLPEVKRLSQRVNKESISSLCECVT